MTHQSHKAAGLEDSGKERNSPYPMDRIPRSKACGDEEDKGEKDEKIQNKDSIEIGLHDMM